MIAFELTAAVETSSAFCLDIAARATQNIAWVPLRYADVSIDGKSVRHYNQKRLFFSELFLYHAFKNDQKANP
jgi:hypothetical protein